MNFLYIAMLIPIFGLFYAAFTSWLKYRQQRAMLDVLKDYAQKGEAPPTEVLAALAKQASEGDASVKQPYEMARDGSGTIVSKRRDPAHYWSLVGLFAVLSAGFAYASYSDTNDGSSFAIVAFTMAAVGAWSLIMAIATTARK